MRGIHLAKLTGGARQSWVQGAGEKREKRKTGHQQEKANWFDNASDEFHESMNTSLLDWQMEPLS